MDNQVSIRNIQEKMAEGVPLGTLDEQVVKRLWWAALDIIQNEILLPLNLTDGLWLTTYHYQARQAYHRLIILYTLLDTCLCTKK